MFANIFILIFLYLTFNQLIHTKKLEDILTCANETECDELVEKDVSQGIPTTTTDNIYNTTSTSTSTSSSIYPTQITKINISTMQTPHKIRHNSELKNHTVHKVESTVCECDLTVSSCDINCCCDKDCNEFHLTVFSYCENRPAELYDKRYCYHKNYIERNNTPFILEKLANNLFCILYDNLPPTYSITNDLDIKTNKDLREAMNPHRLTWGWKDQLYVPEYKNSSPYKDNDIIWKIHNNYVEPLEIPQSGFTELCSFKKTVKYLREWKDQCLQTDLISTNKFLFPAAFNNFTVIVSPHLLNETYIMTSNESCPRNVCLTLTNYYCKYSWKTCNNDTVLGSCSNGTCYNIVTGVKYMIIHNGSMGINSFNVYFNIGNVSRHFHQQFEITYEWAEIDKEKTFSLSGNPGYIFGRPLIIGTLQINKTNNVEVRYISFNKTDSFFTLPIATRHGECSEVNRYTPVFGEDIKLRCSVSLQTNNFNTTSCIELQDKIMHFVMKNSLFNVTEIDKYSSYVSKSGHFFSNDTADWTQILLDRVPQNAITGHLINGRAYCSGLITSIQLDILYSALAKPKSLTNYNILGVGITFSEESDIFWSKCTLENCTDILKVDVVSHVTFHDVSKPSKYYFAGSPNLELTLPYDFFYPFLSKSNCIEPNIFLINITFAVLMHNFLSYAYICLYF